MTVAVGTAMSAASGTENSYGALIAFRCLNSGVPLSLSGPTVCNIFFAHERSLYIGIYTVTFITGSHV